MSLIPNINILTVILSFLGLVVLFIVYNVAILPLLRIRFYQKQGLPSYYYPVLGKFKVWMDDLDKHGDKLHSSKQEARRTPSRATVSNLGSKAMINLNDPALIKDFIMRTDNYIKDPVYLDLFKTFLGNGIGTAEGAQWKKQRKMLSNSFHFEFIKSMIPTIQTTTHEHLAKLRASNSSEPFKVDILRELQKITGELIGKIFFGEQLSQFQLDGESLTDVLGEIIVDIAIASEDPLKMLLGGWFVKMGILPKHRKLVKRIPQFRGACNDIIQARKKQNQEKGNVEQSQTKDMLDLLLETNGEDGKIPDEEIIDQFISFYLGGMDTTSHLVTITLYYLDKYPEHQKQIKKEITENYDPKRLVTLDELNNLESTVAFLKETLRTNTPASDLFPRMAVRDHKLRDLEIRKGDTILINYFYNHYNPEFFSDPDEFDPTRWTSKEKGPTNAFAYTPFSAGPRNCIGQHLAMIEARIILSEMLSMYEISIEKGYKLVMDYEFMYAPQTKIMLELKPIAV